MAKVRITKMDVSDKAVIDAAQHGLRLAVYHMYWHNHKEQYTPFDTGATQNFAEQLVFDGEAVIQHITDYSRKIYFDTKTKFRTTHNRNAGSHWWKEYLEGGAHEEVAIEAFEEGMKSKL